MLDESSIGLLITMAPSSNVTGVPRSILPRLTWNSTSPRLTVGTVQPTALSTSTARPQQSHQRKQSWDLLTRQLHALTYSPLSSRFLTAAATSREAAPSSPVSRRSSVSSSNHTASYRFSFGPANAPVRYNGVYVATFKPARRAFHATPSRGRDHHFDTLKFVQRLRDEGYSEEQAVAMMRVLNDVIQESIQNLTRTMVLREG